MVIDGGQILPESLAALEEMDALAAHATAAKGVQWVTIAPLLASGYSRDSLHRHSIFYRPQHHAG